MKEGRKFIRHSVNVPLEVRTLEAAPASAHDGVNISHGGLSFLVDQPMSVDQIIEVSIPTVKPPFEARAKVVWCRPEGVRYCVGVAFLDSTDAFQSRMVQQVCAIEGYRLEQMKKGRRLTTTEACAEWVRKCADRFPS